MHFPQIRIIQLIEPNFKLKLRQIIADPKLEFAIRRSLVVFFSISFMLYESLRVNWCYFKANDTH